VTGDDGGYFTGDQHFGHDGIIGLCKRPFRSVDEMDETMIANLERRRRARTTTSGTSATSPRRKGLAIAARAAHIAARRED
jgi:hypothetical protein